MQNAALVPGRSMQRHRYITKTLIVVQLTTFLLTLAILNVSATGLSQQVTFSGRNVPLESVFEEVKHQTGHVFFYKKDVLEGTTPVTISATNLPLKEFLDKLFINQPIDYLIENNAVIINRKSAPLTGNVNHHSLLLPPPPITVRGRIVNENGEPVIASIVVKGTRRGTTTDADGNFELSNVEENAKLIISGANIEILEFVLANNPEVKSGVAITIRARNKIEEGEAVTISTSYYSTTKAKSTMNIEKINSKDIQDQPVTSLMNSLAGRVAGLDVEPLNGAAGAAPQIRIRGNNSFRLTGTYPLYVIDGMQIEPQPLSSASFSTYAFDPLGSINPGDIESIEVLKDAAATAIYGSRGANGVIKITTKRNKRTDRTNFNINVSSGFGELVKHVELLSREQFFEMRKEAYQNDGEPVATYENALGASGIWDTTRNTDWQKTLLGGKARIDDIQLGFSGGSERTSFRFSAGFHKENVMYSGDFGYKRGTASFSLNHTSSNNKFNAAVSVNFGANKNSLLDDGDFVSNALTLAPTAPALYDNNGELNWQQYEAFPGFLFHSWNNPLASLSKTDEVRSHNWVANTVLSYEIIKGLSLKTNLGYNELASSETTKQPIVSAAPSSRPYIEGRSRFGTHNRSAVTVEPQLNYSREINGHSLNIVFGGAYRRSLIEFQNIEANGYKSDELLGSVAAAGSRIYRADLANEYKYVGLFARIGYDFQGKYLLDISGRRDGSSKFGPGNRFGNFAAAGVGWVFTKENFFEAIPAISFGKIRASYGVTGNDQIGDYIYYDSYLVSGSRYQNTIGLVPKSLLNPDYAWERTTKTELALELGFIQNRINLQTAWYRNMSSNQLVDYPLPATTGFPFIKRNFTAEIENTGLEILINSSNIIQRNFKWSTSVNLTVPKNRLKAFDGIENSPYNFTYKVGEPLSIYRLYTYEGIDPATGDYLIKDLDEDGLITDNDRQFMKPIEKKYYGGILNSFSFKGFELNFLFQFAKGNSTNWLPNSAPGSESRNYQSMFLDRWRKPGDNAAWGRYTNNADFKSNFTYVVSASDLNVTDASFIRLKTLSLSYQFSPSLLSKAGVNDLRVYFQAQNLATFSDYPGFDPETGNSSLPPLRMLTLGIQANL